MQLNCYFRSASCPTGMTNQWAGTTGSTKTRSRSAIGNFLLAMRITAMIILVASLSVSAKGVSQNVTFSGRDVSLEKVFDEVKKQTGLKILYTEDVFTAAKPISIEAVNLPVDDFVALVLKNQAVKFIIENRTIFISKKEPPAADLSPRLPLPPPPITVKGRVVNERGDAVIASILIKGSNKGVNTDIDGNFVIQNVDPSAILIVSGISIETQEINVSNRSLITVKVVTRINAEEEVVIRTDYFGSTKRKSTMNISKVDGNEIENQPVTTLMNAIVGRVPGLDITPRNGAPGSASAIMIRGNNSLNFNGSYPLYVIDGIQIDFTPIQSKATTLYSAGIDPLSSISPADIESVEVLKDGAATAIYGTKGANGVIKITTKRAKFSATTDFDFNIYSGIGQISKKVDLLSKDQYLAMRNEAFTNSNAEPSSFGDWDFTGAWDTTRTTDWQDKLIGGAAKITDIQGNFSGGSVNTAFRVGGGYHKEGTIYPGDEFGFQRANTSLSINHSSTDKRFEISSGVNVGWTKNKSYENLGYVSFALNLPPVSPKLYNEDGTLNWQTAELFPGFSLETWDNPLARIRNTTESEGNSILANAGMSYELFPGLKVKTVLSYSRFDNSENVKFPIAAVSPSNVPYTTAEASFNTNHRRSIMIEPQLIFARSLGNHHLNAIVGTTWQDNRMNYLATVGTGYSSDAFLNSIRGAKAVSIAANTDAEYKYASLYANISYDYKGKLLLSLTGRRDGSSRFGSGKRYGNFGAVSGGWIFSEENLFQNNLSFLSFGKIRASYGLTGNDQIGDYKYLSTYTLYNPYQGIVSTIPTALFNSDYAWEETKKFEIGIELGFINNRIMIEGAYYRNRSSNQLVTRTLAATAGFPGVLENFDATIQNSGTEFVITTKNISSNTFQWTTSFNLSVPRNKLVKFDGIENSSYAQQYKVGEPTSIQSLYIYKGINPNTGLYEVEDVNNDGIFDFKDRRFSNALGRTSYYGLNNTFNFKNIDVSFLFQFSNNLIGGYLPENMPGLLSNQPVQVLDRWQKEGDVKPHQKFLGVYDFYYGGYVQQSDRNTGDASFIRLKTLSLGYNIPNSLLQKIKIKQVRLYLQGQNLFTFTDYWGLDPETGNTLPPLRIINAGLQFKF